MDRSVLISLFSSGDWKDRFEACLQEGLEIDQCSVDDGWSLVHFAVEAENYAAVNWLYSRGADLNAQDESGNTALHYAVQADVEMSLQIDSTVDFRGTGFLLSLGADPRIKNSTGLTVQDIAASFGDTILMEYKTLEMAKGL